MMKKNKKKEAEAGDKPCASKRKIQQSAPLASTVSTMEMAKKPTAVATEATLLLSPPSPAEVAKGAEDDRKIAAQPKYVAVPRVLTGAVPVEPVAAEEEKHVEESFLKAKPPLLIEKADHKTDGQADQVEDDKDDDDDDEVEDEDLNNDDGRDYRPDEDGLEGIVNLDNDAVAATICQTKRRVPPVHLIFQSFPLLGHFWLRRERRARRYVSVFAIICVTVYVNCSLNVFVSVFNVDYVKLFSKHFCICFQCCLQHYSLIMTTLQFYNDFKEMCAMPNHLSSISVAMNEVVKLLLQLVKVCSDAKASSSVAQGSATKYKADFDEELLSQLKNGKLVELHQELLSWEPHPKLTSYHISFLKNYLALLVLFSSTKPVQCQKKITKVC
jgi:hypothetical protein